ncbi:hypothetical protein [Burkholderia ubonensis]|uniref:hypothetical protein n=1 Tax=Burkholderia ubonensis TaxID=101571 RepID=UPI0007596F9F|nr:hypothetical protein [Burkholderia ubonensis]KVN87179.1 hypothetical protein WJ67_30395 [Burkholderia ubonensis]
MIDSSDVAEQVILVEAACAGGRIKATPVTAAASRYSSARFGRGGAMRGAAYQVSPYVLYKTDDLAFRIMH